METNVKPMTVKDILEDIRTMLGNISIPVSQIDAIGIPVAKAVNGLSLCINAFNQEKEELRKAQEEAQEEPQTEIVPDGENEGNA